MCPTLKFNQVRDPNSQQRMLLPEGITSVLWNLSVAIIWSLVSVEQRAEKCVSKLAWAVISGYSEACGYCHKTEAGMHFPGSCRIDYPDTFWSSVAQ